MKGAFWKVMQLAKWNFTEMEGWRATIVLSAGLWGVMFSLLFGEWTDLLLVLPILIVIDIATGWLSATMNGKLSSKVSARGFAKKVFIVALVACAHLLDGVLGTDNMLRDGTLLFYSANELLSITENAGKIGVPIPSPLKRAIQMLNEKAEGKGEESDEKEGA